MTVAEFLNLFAQYVSLGRWELKGNDIRSADDFCPICFVNYWHNPDSPDRDYKNNPWDTEFGQKMGSENRGIIIGAADNYMWLGREEPVEKVRNQLLELCGLNK